MRAGSYATEARSSTRGTCGSWNETSAPAFRSSEMIFSAGDSRTSPMSGLYATPSTRIREPFIAFCAPWLSAWEMSERQKYGISSLTLPASSMNSVWKPYSRAFHVK